MCKGSSIFVVLLSVLMFAVPASAQSRLGVTIGGSPVSGWSFQLTKPTGTSGFDIKGSTFEIGIMQDRGRDGDRGLFLVRKDMNNSHLTGIEAYDFIPFLKSERVQLGITPHAGVGVWAGEISPTGGAEATLAVKPMSSVKVKFGAGLDYPRLYGIRFGVSYLF